MDPHLFSMPFADEPMVTVDYGERPRPPRPCSEKGRSTHKLYDTSCALNREHFRRQLRGFSYRPRGIWSTGFSPDQVRMLSLGVPPDRVLHAGCINCASWSADGELLFTGSDDKLVKVWGAANGFGLKVELKTGHRHNIIGVAPVPGQPDKIVSCAVDRSLRLTDVETKVNLLLGTSNDVMHGFCFWDGGPGCDSNIVLTAQADGLVCRYDLRERSHQGYAILKSVGAIRVVAVPGPHNHSRGLSPWGLWVGGTGAEIQMYDLRRMPRLAPEDLAGDRAQLPEAVRRFCPSNLPAPIEVYLRHEGVSVSGLTISKDRPEVLVSYQNEQIYAFATDEPDVSHEAYSLGGHLNHKTFIKNVAYWGPREEYVVSGSDQGVIWIWDRASGRIANLLKSDIEVANGAAPHPFLPMLASYGIESTAKIWTVGNEVEGARDKCSVLEDRDQLIEDNLQKVLTPRGAGHGGAYCRDLHAFRERAKFLRSSDGLGWGETDGYLPLHVTDFETPVEEWGPEVLALLQAEKDRGNHRFQAKRFMSAAASYKTVLMYLEVWERAKGNRRKRRTGKEREKGSGVKDIIPPIASLQLGQNGQAAAAHEATADVGEEGILVQLKVTCCSNLAACRLQQQRFNEAWGLANRCLEIQPGHFKALYRRACASMGKREYEKAIEDLKQCKKINPKEQLVIKKLAHAEVALRHAQAVEAMVARAAFFGVGRA